MCMQKKKFNNTVSDNNIITYIVHYLEYREREKN